VALVTGAGRGLGAEMAVALGGAGAEVLVMSRTASDLDQVAARIAAAGGRAKALVCDVKDGSQLRAKIGRLDRLDVLVNNAGMNIPEPFVDVSEAHLDEQLALNVRATRSAQHSGERHRPNVYRDADDRALLCEP